MEINYKKIRILKTLSQTIKRYKIPFFLKNGFLVSNLL